MVTPRDVSFIEPHIKNLNSVLSTLRFTCNHIEIQNEINLKCSNILEPLTIRYNDLVSDYSSISHLISNRARRGAWFGGIGTLSKTIFGTLDEDDAVKYDNAIQTIQNDQKKLSSLLKENILITTSTLIEFNHTLHKVKTNEANLIQAIDNLTSKLKTSSATINELYLKTEINSILNSLEAAILTLSFQIEDIINAIMFSSQNIMHPAILPPTALYQELLDNYRYLPGITKLPVNLELSNMFKLINVSRVISFSLNNKITFVLRIPLVSPSVYELYHSIALPIPHHDVEPNQFSYIVPTNKYIAIDNSKSEYCVLESLHTCVIIDQGSYVCDITTVYSTTANPNCESELITKVLKSVPHQCKTDFIEGNLDVWKEITTNNWIFVQTQSNKLYIECINKTTLSLNIIGTGILSLPTGCSAYCKSTKIISNSNVVKINSVIVQPDFNIINDSCCILDNFQTTKSNEPLINYENIDLDSFTLETKTKLKSLTQEADKIINKHPIIRYETHYSIVTFILIITVTCYVVFRLYSLIKKHNRQSHLLPPITLNLPNSNPTDTQNTNLSPITPRCRLHPPKTSTPQSNQTSEPNPEV